MKQYTNHLLLYSNYFFIFLWNLFILVPSLDSEGLNLFIKLKNRSEVGNNDMSRKIIRFSIMSL